jgi:hypothetical protein
LLTVSITTSSYSVKMKKMFLLAFSFVTVTPSAFWHVHSLRALFSHCVGLFVWSAPTRCVQKVPKIYL